MSRATLEAVVRRLGGELYDGGRRALVPGPGHSPADRSVSLLLADGRVLAHSFAGDDWRSILAVLRELGLVDAHGRLAGGAGGGAPAPSRPEKLACARALWDTAGGIGGTLAEIHLRRRAVTRDLPAGLRFHPGVPAAVYAGRGVRRPALLAAIHDPAGAFCGVEVTYLGRDGAAAAVRVPRKTVGGRPAGAAVRLDVPGETLLVGEGVVTCLSASQALGLPAWALLAVGNLRGWSPPAGVRRLVIAADRGRPGEAGAARLAGRLGRAGLGVAVRPPPAGCADWNDAVRAAEEEAGRGRADRARG